MAGNVDITKSVRQTLVKAWLDMGKIRLQVAGGTIIVRGRIVKSRSESPVNGLFIEELEQRIRSTKGVKIVRWALEDWVHDKGEWKTKTD